MPESPRGFDGLCEAVEMIRELAKPRRAFEGSKRSTVVRLASLE
jgi:hypothetical protein